VLVGNFHGFSLRLTNLRLLFNKYQLSQMNPRDGIVLYTEVDDQCDKLAVCRHIVITGTKTI